MEYNIGFTLGDADGDGKAIDYHIVANHSVDEISKAYKKTTKLLGFNFIEEVGEGFESLSWIPKEFTDKLLNLGIINSEHIVEANSEYDIPAGCFEFYYGEDEFVDIYFDIVKYSLPDLEWSHRDLEEEILFDLYGAASGLIYH